MSDQISKFIDDSKAAILELSPADRFLKIFWLLGPFFLLIERTPGDVWLSTIALTFVFRSLIKGDFDFLKWFWVRSAFVFWFVCLVSASLSAYPSYALGETIAWVRFPLFAMACVFWIAIDKRIIYLMLLSVALAVLLMCCILTAEIVIEGFKTRLSWPYGDLVSGNFLAKAGMPAFVAAAALSLTQTGPSRYLPFLFIIVGLVFVVLTGERINSLILFCGTLLSAVVVSKNWLRLAKFSFAIVGMLIAVFWLNMATFQRFFVGFAAQLPIYEDSSYYNTMAPAFLALRESPLFGVGTASLRVLCADFVRLHPTMECGNHPHNYYLQLLGETGVLGFGSGVIFLCAVVWMCFKTGSQTPINPIVKVAWVVPFGLFWPIASTADFFGQWNNIFMWSSIALAMSLSSNKRILHA